MTPGPGDLLDPAQHPILTPEQVATALGVSRSTAYEWLRQGRLPSVRLSARKTVIPTAALVAVLTGASP